MPQTKPSQSALDHIRQARAARVTIGILTALPYEAAAVKALFCDPMADSSFSGGRSILATLGKLSGLNGTTHIVAHRNIDGAGNSSAAARAAGLVSAYPTIKYLLMVGICGGCPDVNNVERHVRLGDIVISGRFGVKEFDFGQYVAGKVEVRDESSRPGATLLEAVGVLQSKHARRDHPERERLAALLTTLSWSRPEPASDELLDSDGNLIEHPVDSERLSDQPRTFVGAIASSNAVLKDPNKRDELRDTFKTIGVEMEGAGVASAAWDDERSYMVVRGVCDYCDKRNKNDVWHKYAAAAAAAATAAILAELPGE